MALSLPLSCSKLQAEYEFTMVITLDWDYLPNVERLYEFNHHLASNQNQVYIKRVIKYNIPIKTLRLVYSWIAASFFQRDFIYLDSMHNFDWSKWSESIYNINEKPSHTSSMGSDEP